jgi:hypothetical protein
MSQGPFWYREGVGIRTQHSEKFAISRKIANSVGLAHRPHKVKGLTWLHNRLNRRCHRNHECPKGIPLMKRLALSSMHDLNF